MIYILIPVRPEETLDWLNDQVSVYAVFILVILLQNYQFFLVLPGKKTITDTGIVSKT